MRRYFLLKGFIVRNGLKEITTDAFLSKKENILIVGCKLHSIKEKLANWSFSQFPQSLNLVKFIVNIYIAVLKVKKEGDQGWDHGGWNTTFDWRLLAWNMENVGRTQVLFRISFLLPLVGKVPCP